MIEQILVNLWNSFLAITPNILAAIIILLIGLIVGKVVGRVVKEILIRARVDEWVAGEGKLTFKFSNIFDIIARWIIYLVFIQQAAISLGVEAISSFINSIIGILPGLIEAAIIVIIGYTLAIYIKDKIVSSRTMYSDIIGKVVFFLLIYLSIALALPFVNIDPTLINSILLVIIGGVSLGMAIAIGFGLKGIVEDAAKDYVKKFKTRR